MKKNTCSLSVIVSILHTTRKAMRAKENLNMKPRHPSCILSSSGKE